VVRSRAGAVKSPWNPSFAPRRGCTRWVVQCGQNYAKPTTTRELAPFAVGEVRRCAQARAAEQGYTPCNYRRPLPKVPEPLRSAAGCTSRPSDLIFERLIRSGQRPPPHTEPARIMAHAEVRVQNNAIDAIVAPAQQVLIESAQPVRHGGQVTGTLPPASNCLVGATFSQPGLRKSVATYTEIRSLCGVRPMVGRHHRASARLHAMSVRFRAGFLMTCAGAALAQSSARARQLCDDHS
jgi:hypothetical protein